MSDARVGLVTAREIRDLMGPQGNYFLDDVAGLVAARIAALVAERWRAEEGRIEPLLREGLRHASENRDLLAEIVRLRAREAKVQALVMAAEATLQPRCDTKHPRCGICDCTDAELRIALDAVKGLR